MSRVLMNDFRAEPQALRDATRAAIDRVIDSGWYVLGPEVEAFERAWAARCDSRFGIGTASGLDAIEIGLRAMGIGPGDEVITTPTTAFATTLAILRSGATPVLADIDPQSAQLDPGSVARCMTERTRAVLLVHLYGQLRRVPAWARFCGEHEIALIEDCAQAHLARCDGHAAGSFGAFGAFSFYPTKNLGALGDAGMLVTQDASMAEIAARLRNYGQSERYHHPETGMNSRLDEMQAAILAARLDWLEAFTARRREIAARYREHIDNPHIQLLAAPDAPEQHVYHLFVVTTDARERLMAHLEDAGVQTLIHYPVPVHEQPPCIGLARDPAGLPEAERFASTCVSLPCHPQMSDDDIERVILAIASFDG